MKIHFCDLCNESVPQSDLDEGRAFLRKGRVVCASCDQSMSPDGTPAGPFGAGGAGALAGVVAPVGSGQPGPAPAGPGHAGAAAPYQPPVYQQAPRARGGSGAGIGLMALLFTGGLAFWGSSKFDSLDSELTGRTQRLEDAQYDARLRFEQELGQTSDSARELGEGLRGDLREMRDWLNAELAESQLQAREVRSRIDAFGERIESMSEAFGTVKRHDQELVQLQQRYNSLLEQFEGLAAVAGDPQERGAAAPAAPEVVAELEEPTAPPPWMGLVEQLASPNTSERWQAVVALGETRDSAVSEYLVPALADEDIFIRMVTARVLGDLGSPVGIPALIDALDDSESAVREAAYIALRTLTKRDLPFDPVTEDASDRARRIKAWREWWDKEKGRYLEG